MSLERTGNSTISCPDCGRTWDLFEGLNAGDTCPSDDCPSNDYLKPIADAARKQWCSDDLEIDEELTKKDFAPGEDGTWVRAWVWVRNDSLPSPDEEGIDE